MHRITRVTRPSREPKVGRHRRSGDSWWASVKDMRNAGLREEPLLSVEQSTYDIKSAQPSNRACRNSKSELPATRLLQVSSGFRLVQISRPCRVHILQDRRLLKTARVVDAMATFPVHASPVSPPGGAPFPLCGLCRDSHVQPNSLPGHIIYVAPCRWKSRVAPHLKWVLVRSHETLLLSDMQGRKPLHKGLPSAAAWRKRLDRTEHILAK